MIWIKAKTAAPGHESAMIILINAAAVGLALAIGLAVIRAEAAELQTYKLAARKIVRPRD